jgi:imidazoleglycerol-phosphate dehydratase/histidinol-phosphatase
MNRVLFLDRDGTLIAEPPDCQVDALSKVRLVPGVIPALLRVRDAGFRLVMVTNQDGLGTAAFPEKRFRECHEHVLELFRSQGIEFDAVFVCPHLEQDGCDCRKPKTGLVTRYLASTPLDVRASAMVGDRATDLEFAERLGIRGFRLGAGYDGTWPEIAARLCAPGRRAVLERRTRETTVQVTVDLDAPGPVEVATGIGFYDHMLEQVAKHGGFSLRLSCRGDLHVDEHHTVEDTALALGAALKQALGDKRGVARYGFLLPMDESEAKVSLDLSGRPYCVFSGGFPRSEVGGLPTELVPHFFRSLADALGAALHLEIRGENTHHMVEACFKGVGRALRQALHLEDADVPSTKGVLA